MENELTEEEFLKNYDSSKFEKPSVTVDMLNFTILNEKSINYRKLDNKKLSILLIKRKGHPCKGKWALPGGFVNMDESLEEASRRELKEETNVDNVYMEQLYTYGDVNRDPRTRVISVAYLSLINSDKLMLEAGDDAEDAKWFNVDYKLINEFNDNETKQNIIQYRLTLTSDSEVLENIIEVKTYYNGQYYNKETSIIKTELAFDHSKIISYGIERLKNKIEYTDIAFNLMNEYFTLSELQQVYEIILDKELLTANFRRKINHLVIETNKYSEKKSGHRPSKLFKFNYRHEREVN